LQIGCPQLQYTIVGSTMLGAATGDGGVHSDVDIVAAGPLAAEEALQQLQLVMETCGLVYNVYQVGSAFKGAAATHITLCLNRAKRG
jgi:hypothetical protein